MNQASRWCAAAIVLLGWVGPSAADDPCGAAVRPYAAAMLDRLVLGAEALAKRIEAKDLTGARQAWIEARVGWLRGQPVLASYFPDAAAAIDAGPEAASGFAALGRLLFVDEDVEAAARPARKLVGDAVALRWRLEAAEFDAPRLSAGLVAAAAALGQVRTWGGPAHTATSLDATRDRLHGIETVYALSFATLSRSRQPALHARIVGDLIALHGALREPSLTGGQDATVAALGWYASRRESSTT